MVSLYALSNTIFVFGSNLAGRHGAGAALHAVKHWGAIPGRGIGPQGRAYALPTKDAELKPLPLVQIAREIELFYDYAGLNPELLFLVTPLGSGPAGYTRRAMSREFQRATLPANLLFTKEWFETT